jgi:hypothetical protein
LVTLGGNADAANSCTDVPAGTARWDPSGRVMVTWDIAVNLELRT